MSPPADHPDLILVTGPSGAGRTTAIHALEDTGYEVIDNIPLSLVTRLTEGGLDGPLALVLDVRNRDFSVEAMVDLVENLRNDAGLMPRLLYLDCDRDTLVARFSETRRRHPLAPAEDAELGVGRELELLAPLADRADVLIDTSGLTVHDLKREVGHFFGLGRTHLAVSVQSFSYKRGVPRGLDMVLDVRFLANPHWVPDLRGGTGRDAAVRDHITADPNFAPFWDRVRDLVLTLLPAYREEGRAHLSIGFGCTGGRHRSVALTEMLSAALAEAGWQVSKRHRELDRRATAVSATGPGDTALGGSAA